MNEKLLPTTVGTLDENELKKMRNSIYGALGIPASVINSNSVCGMYGTYGTHSAADVRPTYMNDQVWMDICKPYLIPLDRKLLTCEDIFKMVDTMIADAGYPDERNLRVLAGTYSKEVGLLMCLAKKVWGTNTSGSNFNDYISKVISEKEENE